jgi:type I restriction enzyme S subunit
MSSETKLKKEVSVSEIADIFIGGTPNTSINEYWEGNILWASAKDVSNCDSIYIEKQRRELLKKELKIAPQKYCPKIQ